MHSRNVRAANEVSFSQPRVIRSNWRTSLASRPPFVLETQGLADKVAVLNGSRATRKLIAT